MSWTRAARWAALAVIFAAGCENNRPNQPPAPQSQPPAAPAAQSPAVPPASQPAAQRTGRPPKPGEQPPLGPPAATIAPSASQPAEEPPVAPDFVQVLERVEAQRRYNVGARYDQPSRLWLTTDNVKRMRIEREHVELTARGSVSLQIDGQPIEWLASARIVELERSVNGVWTARDVSPKPVGQKRR